MEKAFILCGFAVLCGLIAFFIKDFSPGFSVAVSLCASVMVLYYVFGELSDLLTGIKEIAESGNVTSDIFASLMKITLISLAGQWSASVCRDVGQNSLAEKTETAVKILVAILTLPYIEKLFQLVREIE